MNIKLTGLLACLFVLVAGVSSMAHADNSDEPSLPSGLETTEPALPVGIDQDDPPLPGGLDDGEPDLPSGMGGVQVDEIEWDDSGENDWATAEEASFTEQLGINGFWEVRGGYRTRSPVDQRHVSMTETRLELEKQWYWQSWTAKTTADLLYDDVEESLHNDLESGAGWLDLREFWIQRRLGDAADVKFGRQILTWGVGDLLFINDLFPKDWNSFLIGRDDQYLKAPSDALRVGLYSDIANVNLVYTPRFDSDRYIDGRRISYFSPLANDVVGRNGLLQVDKPDHTGEDDELALRLYRQFGVFDAALYAYRGFWKSPGGFDAATGLGIFPELRVYGASARGQLGVGIFSSEIGYYDSRQDRNGDNPFINNSEWRGLLGYEWEVASDTTLGFQYYVEALQDYAAYQTSLFPGQPARDEYRQVLTARITRLAMNQNLTLSLFGFYSPTDEDYYVRPTLSYKATDHWTLSGGLNLFGGDQPYTFFGQFESNSNVYVSLRYGF